MSGETASTVNVMQALKSVLTKMEAAVARRSKDLPQITPTLVAVSKIRPASMIVEAYETGQRDFGENYVNELSVKANDPLILENCKDIRWHLIGPLQSNKINKVLSVPRLHIIQTVHTQKLADTLNKQWVKYRKEESQLGIFVQVNTSGEDAKSGIEPANAFKLVEHVITKCPNLNFKGLMTIGEYDYDTSRGPNPDFISLAKIRQEVCEKLKLDINKVELSMGMSTDYEHAIETGATTVRVGTLIFGPRPKTRQGIIELSNQLCDTYQ